MSLFGYDFKGNAFNVIEAWYATSYPEAEYRHIYSGFPNLEEAVSFARKKAEEKPKVTNTRVIDGDNNAFVSAIVPNGRYVFTCLPVVDISK